MGLNIKEIVSRQNIEIPDLKGKTVSVDAFNTLYQFLSTIRQQDGSPLMDEKGNITSHLSGILYRNVALLKEGIKLIYVFDGEPPKLKEKIHKKRREVKEQAEERYNAAKQSENIEEMRKYAQQLTRLDDEMIKESKELLQAMGICVVQAPGEGEAQAAYLSRQKGVYATVSQDYDSLIFGAPTLIRNLTLSKKKRTFSGFVEVKPEIIKLKNLLNELEINQDQLICIAIMVGTDYNPKGIPRIGQKKALKLVKEFVTPEEIFKHLEEKINDLPNEDKFDWEEIFSLFKAAKINDPEIIFPQINSEKIQEILVERHGFSEERIQRQIEKLTEIKKSQNQKSLDKWF